MKPKAKGRIIYVRNRLGELLLAEGGIDRDEAIAEADRLVEIERTTSEGDIGEEIAYLESMLQVSARGKHGISVADMRFMLRKADSLLTLTGTFGFNALDTVAKSFCDLLNGMILKKLNEVDPIAVHLRAMHLFAPGGPALGDEEAKQVFTHLRRILQHFGCEPIPREIGFPGPGAVDLQTAVASDITKP
jgi:hypothetical protein